MVSNTASLVHFAEYTFDLDTGELRLGSTPLRLPPQPAKVLAILIRNAGKVVTRQQLVDEVWGGETFVDYEQGLNFAIRQIRTVLEDDADHPAISGDTAEARVPVHRSTDRWRGNGRSTIADD